MAEGLYRQVWEQIKTCVCARCGAVVAYDDTDRHDEWHDLVEKEQ